MVEFGNALAGSGWGQEVGEHHLWVEYAGLGVDGILMRVGYKITYPNGNIDVGKDFTSTVH